MHHIELNDEMKYLSDLLQQYILCRGWTTMPYPRDLQAENNRIRASKQRLDKQSSFVPHKNKNSITMISHKRRSRFYLHAEFTDSGNSCRILLPLYRKLPQHDIVPSPLTADAAKSRHSCESQHDIVRLPPSNCFINE